MGTFMIDQIVLVRTSANINNADLFEVQIKDGGSDDQKSAKMTFEELSNAVNGGVTPLKYKALLSQNAPIATTQTPTIVAGQIWEDTIGTVNAADLVILGGYELISGVLGAINAKYRSAAAATPTFVTSSLAYDGSPYVVSTDANGDFNPFVNTLGGVPVLSRIDKGYVYITKKGAFPQNKISLSIQKQGLLATNVASKSEEAIRWGDADTIILLTTDGIGDVIAGTTDGILYYHLVEIEVYP